MYYRNFAILLDFKNTHMPDKPAILCAALWYDDGKQREHNPPNVKTGIVVCGYRHCNCFTVLSALFQNSKYKGLKEKTSDRKTVQGFLTNAGTFVNRMEGYKIALAAGQCTKSAVECLMSEDLY